MHRKSRYERLWKLSNGDLPASTIRYARRYLADYPDHGPAWLLMGTALTEMGRYEEAKRALSKAIELCPLEKRQIAFSGMGHMFRQRGDYEQAEKWYRRAIEADPDDATYHIYLGSLFAKQGRLSDAEEVHRTAICCAEGCIDEAYLKLGLVLRAQERFQEAAECFREAIQLDPAYRAARRALQDVERCIRWSSRRHGGS
jgi:tetratricopeptide (TPR) repeat protein